MDLPVRIIQLIRSYTSNTHFKVHANHQTSSIRPITAGVPRGLVLGPVLYSLHVNDIPKPVDHRIINVMYAYNTVIMAKSLNIQILGKLLQNHLDLVGGYLVERGLKVNVDSLHPQNQNHSVQNHPIQHGTGLVLANQIPRDHPRQEPVLSPPYPKYDSCS